MKSKKNSAYIAYFDLLGTRGFCEDSEVYFENIKAFYEAIEQVSYVLKDQGSVGVFSDCAYAESNDLSYLLEFLVELRNLLNAQELYFNAVVKKGDLGIESVQTEITENTMFGVKFTESDITTLYIEQNNFKGVGIKVHEGIWQDVQRTQYKLVDCVYVATKEVNHVKVYYPVSYKDIAYNPEGEWDMEAGAVALLNTFLKVLISSYVKKPKYGAYYLSALVNLLRSYAGSFSWSPSGSEIKTSSIIFRSVEKMLKDKYSDIIDLPGLEYLPVVMLDVVYNCKETKDLDKQLITKKITGMECFKKAYAHSLDNIPEELFAGNSQTRKCNRNLLIQLCQAELSSNFVEGILSQAMPHFEE